MGRARKLRSADSPATETLRTTPWAWRDEEGLYLGWNRQGWLYREFPLNPLTWEDPVTQLRLGTTLANLLYELADTAKDRAGGISMFAERREFHMVAVGWSVPGVPPEGTPEGLRRYIDESLRMMASTTDAKVVARKALLIGVRLRSSTADAVAAAAMAKDGSRGKERFKVLADGVRATLTSVLGEDVPDPAVFDADRAIVTQVLDRAGCRFVSRDAGDQLEAWYNHGLSPDVTLLETRDVLATPAGERLEMASVMRFENPVLQSPRSTWLLDAMTYSDSPAAVVSVRGELEPATIARARARSNQRKIIAQVQEEEETGDLGRVENVTTFQLAQQLETMFAQGEPLVARCSIVLGRRVVPGAESYIDDLRTRYGIRVRPLEHRQLAALDETLPCSDKRVNPFTQDVTIPMLAYAGLSGFSELGDPTGVLVGLTAPDWTPCYLNPLGAPAADLPPALLVAGDPGSGKAQPLDAPVLTPSGWTTMGELQVGDDVVAVDGTPTRVVAVYPQGVRPIYRVTFHDGTSAEADGEHLWAVAKSREYAAGRPFKTMNTDELRSVGLRDGDGERRWRIPVAAAVAHPERDLPIHPYLLGALLGDGALTHRVGFSGADPAVVERVAGLLPGTVRMVRSRTRPHDYNLTQPQGSGANPLRAALHGLGLFGRRSTEKFIPAQYLHASVEQRVALLQGLLDTDGEPTCLGAAQFHSSSPDLAAGVAELVRSLGGTAQLSTKPTPKYRHAGEERVGATAYRVAIRLPQDIDPFSSPTKAALWRSVERPEPVRIIDSIDYVGEKPAQCILVDHPSHLYLTADHVVTHNTFLAQNLATQCVLAGLNTWFINPKGLDSLAPFAELVGGEVVKLSAVEGKGGFFDPFRFCPDPTVAAKIATDFILDVLGSRGVGTGFTPAQEIALGAGLQQGAAAGARCVADALRHVDDPEVLDLVRRQAVADPTFSLGISNVPVEAFEVRRGLTLIEFDRQMDFPEAGTPPSAYSRPERITLAIVRLVTRVSIEALAATRGGAMFVDEAWTFLSSSEGLATVQRLGRLGRSQNLLPVFITQRVADIVKEGVDMEGFLSRVFVLKLNDPREAKAALRLCGLEATQARIDWLREAGPRRGRDGMNSRPALALHRDLHGRHSAVLLGPVPPAAATAFTTNPEDRKRREAARGQAAD